MFALIPWFKLTTWHLALPFLQVAIPIQPFGLLAALAILIGSRVATWRARASDVPTDLVNSFIATVVPIGLVSAMLLNVLLYEPDQLHAMARAIASWGTPGPNLPFPYPGLSSFGGFFGALLGAWYFRARRGVSLLIMADVICFALPFAWVFARAGCFLVHDHPGVVSHFVLAVDDYNRQGQPRHDLGLYEVLWSAGMLPILVALARKRLPAGAMTAFVSLSYATVRFGLDFLRAPADQGGDVRHFGLTPAQYAAAALAMIAVGVAGRAVRGKSPPLMLSARPPRGQRSVQPLAQQDPKP